MSLYSVGTWDMDLHAFTPQAGLSVPCFNVPLWTLKRALVELRSKGYDCHRFRDPDGGHESNDYMVLVERTDGMNEADILESWTR